jgi:hypothetical protein
MTFAGTTTSIVEAVPIEALVPVAKEAQSILRRLAKAIALIPEFMMQRTAFTLGDRAASVTVLVRIALETALSAYGSHWLYLAIRWVFGH